MLNRMPTAMADADHFHRSRACSSSFAFLPSNVLHVYMCILQDSGQCLLTEKLTSCLACVYIVLQGSGQRLLTEKLTSCLGCVCIVLQDSGQCLLTEKLTSCLACVYIVQQLQDRGQSLLTEKLTSCLACVYIVGYDNYKTADSVY